MDRDELRKLIQGTVVTTPTPMDKDMKVDYARITDVTRWWVEQGLGTNVAPLKGVRGGRRRAFAHGLRVGAGHQDDG